MTLEELLALLERAEGDLSTLSAAELGELRDQLFAGFNEFRPTVVDDEGVEALTRVAEAIAAVDVALASVGPEDGDEGDGGDGDGGEQSTIEERLAALDRVVLVRDEDVPPTLGGPTSGVGLVKHTVGEAPNPHADASEPGTPDAPTNEEPPENVDRSARRNRPSINALANSLPTPEVPQATPEYRIIASANGVPGVAGGSQITLAQLGSVLERQHRAMQTVPSWKQLDPESVNMGADGQYHGVGGMKHYIGEIEIAKRPGVVIDTTGTRPASEMIDQATREMAQARDERDAYNARMVASGGNCVLALPDYSINVVGDRGTCFTDTLPTVSSPRPMAYYPWLEINQSAGATGPGSMPAAGIGFVTEAQDRAGYGDPTITPGTPPAVNAGQVPVGGAAYKSCIHIDCPANPLTCDLEMVYKCVTIGNFQAQSHPEYVAAFQEYMDIWFDIERDNRALAKYVAQAVANSKVIRHDELTFGAASSLKDVLNRFVAHERSSHHAQNLNFNVVAPDWFGGYLATDIMRHTFGSLDNLRATPAEAMSLASTDGIRVSTYCTEPGVTSGASAQDMVLAPIGSTIPAWPNRARLLLYPDGAVFKKTGASLQFGLRETLLKTNDFGMFMELSENVCFRTGRVWVLDIALCQNGATGAPVALVCS